MDDVWCTSEDLVKFLFQVQKKSSVRGGSSSARRAGAGDFNQPREDKRLHCGVLADHLRCCFLEEGDEGQRWDPNPAQRHSSWWRLRTCRGTGASPHLRSACIPASANGSSAGFSASTARPRRLQQTPRWPTHLPAALVAAEARTGSVKDFQHVWWCNNTSFGSIPTPYAPVDKLHKSSLIGCNQLQ